MSHNTLVTYSSLTGNTKMVAGRIYEIIEGDKKLISLNDIKEVDINQFDRIVVGFWVDKGTADKRTREFIKKLSQKEVAYFGTLGADPYSEHGEKVRERVTALCSEKNGFLGGFLCRGKIDPKLVEKMGKFPLKLVHPLTPERLKRIEDAKPHPNEKDFQEAEEYFKNILNK
ncbi:flavodoxin family protein [Fusobacterium sp.]|uniref:flavodoxin family protein n=1 Tax=Fusobacterium sp. TaxID=68766 RepID=UPI002611D4F8|nr:flavodoxin family protein [Fusobacterium sp.]